MYTNRNFKFFFIFLTLFLGGCAGASDYKIDLPGKHSIIRTSANNVTIAPKIDENLWGADVVPAEVIEVGWNEEYIIAKQRKGKESKSFWIIKIESGKVTGPLNTENFMSKKEEYSIDEDISLIKVQDLDKDY
ncbi:DUF3997 domain-containing protein [Cytobacillus gottheilii]|uniref:DUF3997 domain-containing protein n=1 Tax=Cytobacillus gottheilii TaxID=859144 RepID=UPI002493E602|nr:DUF3997 domain-containing protein [Cytobacillus gottheilii]